MPVAASPGVIEAGKVYTLEEFQSRTGLKRFAMRSARREGLEVLYRHGRAFVRGDDWLRYLAKHDA